MVEPLVPQNGYAVIKIIKQQRTLVVCTPYIQSPNYRMSWQPTTMLVRVLSQRVGTTRRSTLISAAANVNWQVTTASIHRCSISTLRLHPSRCQRYEPAKAHNLLGRLRYFTSSAILNKKKDKGKKGSDTDVTSKSSKADTASDDPLDLSELHNGIAEAINRLKDDISKLRAGGRFNPEVIENLRVHLTKRNKEAVKLGELAQVIPRGGRMVSVLVGEEDVSDYFYLFIFIFYLFIIFFK